MSEDSNHKEYERGVACLLEGKLFRAERIANRLIEQSYSGGDELKARCLYARGEREEAIAVLERAVEKSPTVCMLWDYLGEFYSDGGRYADALAAFHQSRSVGGNIGVAGYNLAVTYGRMGDFEQALKFLETAGNDVTPKQRLHAKSWILASLMRLSDALKAADELVAIEPEFSPAHGQRALALQGLGRTHEAREAALQALALDLTEEAALRALCMQNVPCDESTRMFEVDVLVKPRSGVDPFPGLRVDGLYRSYLAAAKSAQEAVSYFADIIGDKYTCELGNANVVQHSTDGYEGVRQVSPKIVSFAMEENPIKRLGLMIQARRYRPQDKS
jgi:tetratricopeptide (TPR) repeat protein